MGVHVCDAVHDIDARHEWFLEAEDVKSCFENLSP